MAAEMGAEAVVVTATARPTSPAVATELVAAVMVAASQWVCRSTCWRTLGAPRRRRERQVCTIAPQCIRSRGEGSPSVLRTCGTGLRPCLRSASRSHTRHSGNPERLYDTAWNLLVAEMAMAAVRGAAYRWSRVAAVRGAAYRWSRVAAVMVAAYRWSRVAAVMVAASRWVCRSTCRRTLGAPRRHRKRSGNVCTRLPQCIQSRGEGSPSVLRTCGTGLRPFPWLPRGSHTSRPIPEWLYDTTTWNLLVAEMAMAAVRGAASR